MVILDYEACFHEFDRHAMFMQLIEYDMGPMFFSKIDTFFFVQLHRVWLYLVDILLRVLIMIKLWRRYITSPKETDIRGHNIKVI